MGPIRSVLHVMSRPLTFTGRASFSEFWWFTGLTVVVPWLAFTPLTFSALWQMDQVGPGEMVAYVALMMAGFLSDAAFAGWHVVLLLGGVVLSLWHYVAWFAVGVRRMHDTGRSAVFYTFVYLLPPLLAFYMAANFAYLIAIDDPDVAETVLQQLAPFAILLLPVMGLYGVITLWFWVVMFFPGDPTPNRFGPKPEEETSAAGARVATVIPGAPSEEGAGLSAADLRDIRRARMEQVGRA